jgi:hypothetical protein
MAKPAPGKGDGRQVQVLEMSTDEVRAHLAALRLIALSLGRFLALSHDARELAGLIVPDFDSFYWSDPSVRAQFFSGRIAGMSLVSKPATAQGSTLKETNNGTQYRRFWHHPPLRQI